MWQVPEGHVPIGRGIGKGGFGSVDIPLGALPAETFVGNPELSEAPAVPMDRDVAKALLHIMVPDITGTPAFCILGNNTANANASPIGLTATQAKVLLAITIADVLNLQTELDTLAALIGQPLLGFETVADLTAFSPADDNAIGVVFDDPGGNNPNFNGIWLWDLGTTTWTWVAPYSFQQLDARLTIIEAQTLDFRTVTNAGWLFFSDGTAGGGSWGGRVDLNETFQSSTDWANAALYQAQSSNYLGAPSEYTLTTIGSTLEFERTKASGNLWPLGAATLDRNIPKRVVLVEATFTALTKVSGNAGCGVGLLLTNTQPAVGTAPTTMQAGDVLLFFRDVGGYSAVLPDALTPAPGVTLSSAGVGNPAWDVDQRVGVRYTFDLDDPTKCNMVGIINGNYVALDTNIEGLAGFQYMAAVGLTFNNGDTFIIETLKYSDAPADIPREWCFWNQFPGVPNGSRNAPWTDPREFLVEDSVDTYRRQKRLLVRAGDYNGSLVFNGGQLTNLDLRTIGGQKARIFPGTLIASGSAYWTRPDIPNFPTIWAGISEREGAGIIDVSAGVSQPSGRTGSVTNPWIIYGRANPNTSLATLAANPGVTSTHTSGPYNGMTLFATTDGNDPNGKDLRLCLNSQRNAVNVFFDGNAATWQVPIVNIQGIEAYFSLSHLFNFERCYINLNNLVAGGAVVGNGIQANETDGIIAGVTITGTMFDNINASGNPGTWPATQRDSQLHVLDSTLLGCPLPYAASTVPVGGDNISNHVRQHLHMVNVTMKAAAKCGLVGETWTASDCDVSDAASAAFSVVASTIPGSGILRGGTAIGCDLGFQCLGNNADATMILSNGTYFQDNVSADLQTFTISAGTAHIQKGPWSVSGPTPAFGREWLLGGTISGLQPTILI